MARILLGAVFCSLFAAGLCLYTANDDVVTLTPSNFQRDVVQSDELWLVEFFAPWCGHCRNLVPEWKKAATALKGVVKVGAVDCDQHKSLGGQYAIQGYPTIKIFGANKNKPEEYRGERTSAAIVEGALNAIRTLVKSRVSGGGGGGGGSDYTKQTQLQYLQTLLQQLQQQQGGNQGGYPQGVGLQQQGYPQGLPPQLQGFQPSGQRGQQQPRKQKKQRRPSQQRGSQQQQRQRRPTGKSCPFQSQNEE